MSSNERVAVLEQLCGFIKYCIPFAICEFMNARCRRQIATDSCDLTVAQDPHRVHDFFLYNTRVRATHQRAHYNHAKYKVKTRNNNNPCTEAEEYIKKKISSSRSLPSVLVSSRQIPTPPYDPFKCYSNHHIFAV
ncbi:hypothetical protein CBL_12611 [Carabus blaptoides fortunei]